MIEVKNLTKKYGDHTVVNHLNFIIEQGKVYGFLGPNGAGKSTTMNMITGCLAPTEGQVLIDGHDIYDDAVNAKRYIGYLPEIPPVYPDMTPEEYLRFVAEAKGIRPSEVTAQVYQAMEDTDILRVKNRLIRNLSKGYRQRVGIAQATLGDPKLIILDEPTVGLDPRQISEIRDLIIRLGKTRTIILSSHILSEVSAVCDHVMIIRQGNLVASDTLENIRKENMPENRIEMTVRANREAIAEVLNGIRGIENYTVTESAEGDHLYDVFIEVSPDTDIREKLFMSFAEKHYSVRKLAKAEMSLEEIFFMLTDDVAEVPPAAGEQPEDTGSADEDGEDDGDDIPDDGEESDNGDDYKPLFGGRRNTEDEE